MKKCDWFTKNPQFIGKYREKHKPIDHEPIDQQIATILSKMLFYHET